MSTLIITKNYLDTDILYEADLDKFKDDAETYFNTTGITGSNIQTNILTASSKLDNSAITTAKIQDNAVTEAKIETGSSTTGISTSNINTDAITTVKIQDLAITNAKLAGSITHDKIATNALDDNQLMYTKNTATGSTSGVTITLSNQSRPVLIMFDGDADSGLDSYVGYNGSIAYINIKRDGTTIFKQQISGTAATFTTVGAHPATAFIYIDTGATGTTATYSAEFTDASTNSIVILKCMEL